MQATSNGKLIQAGISEKLGLVIQGFATFISAFVIAFVTQWKLTFIALSIAPAILLAIGIAGTLEAGLESQILQVLAGAGSFAESLLSSARTIKAFSLRPRLVKDFDIHLQKAQRIASKKSPLFGCLFSAEYSIMYAGTALTFWQGVKMLARHEISEPGDIFVYVPSQLVS